MTTQIQYEPYSGPAGPTIEQQENNNRYMLGLLLDAGYSDAHMAPDTITSEACDVNIDELANVVFLTVAGQDYFISYDRWGYGLYHVKLGQHLDVDQSEPEEVLAALKAPRYQ